MNRKLLVIFVFLSPLLVNQSFALDFNGEIFLRAIEGKSQTDKDRLRWLHSTGFLQGVVSSYIILSAQYPLIKSICFPEPAPELNQIRLIVLKWFNNHPEKLHEPASYLILLALSEAFPCK